MIKKPILSTQYAFLYFDFFTMQTTPRNIYGATCENNFFLQIKQTSKTKKL